MRLAVYTYKFFNFLAEKLRRLAEFMSVKSAAEKESFDSAAEPNPLADWLEKTKHIAPEQWIDFSGEANEAPPTVLPGAGSFSEPDFLAEKSKKEYSDSQKSEIHPKTGKTSENDFKITLPQKRKNDSRFLSFRVSEGKNQTEKAPETNIFRQCSFKPPPENKEPAAGSKSKFRLLPRSPILLNKPKAVDSDLSAEKTFGAGNSESNKPLNIFKDGKPVENSREPVLFETKAKNKQESRITGEQFFPINSEKLFAETPEPGFSFSEPKPLDSFDFEPKLMKKSEAPKYFPGWKKSGNNIPENVISERNRRNAEAERNTIFGTPNWIELPDDISPDNIVETNLNIEHLKDLEREQKGRRA